MEHFVLIVNRIKDPKLTVAESIRAAIERRGCTCTVMDAVSDEPAGERRLPEDAECAIVLGGDGTMLQAARLAAKRNVPLLGVNLGTLGYLAEVEIATVEEALDMLCAGNYTIEERMMLSGAIGEWREDALNDIVITRSGPLQVIRLTVHVNDKLLTNYQADGIILSTPTGSTGYNLSAGGPVVDPAAQTILLTPISSHNLTNRSIVLSPDARIRVEVGEGQGNVEPRVGATFDGNVHRPMAAGDVIDIVRSQTVTRIVRLRQVSFLELLRTKLL